MEREKAVSQKEKRIGMEDRNEGMKESRENGDAKGKRSIKEIRKRDKTNMRKR